MVAGTVSVMERKLAQSLSRDVAGFERKSIMAATKFGFRLMQSVISAYKRRDPTILERVSILFRRMAPVMTDVMTVAHLQGLMADRKRRTLSLSIHSEAIKALQKRLELPAEMVRGIAATNKRQALSVLNGSSYLVEKKLQEAILGIEQRGEHVREGVKQLHKTFDSLGITPRSSFQLETIFRTQTRIAYSAGRWQSLQDPDVQEILWGYKLVTVGDDRVRDAHEPMDGTTLPKEDPYWEINWTPNGWACRCQMIAIYEERDHVRPPERVEVDGKTVYPGADKGFRYNPGKVFTEMEGVQVKPAIKKPIVKPKPKPVPKPKLPIPKPKPTPIPTKVIPQSSRLADPRNQAMIGEYEEVSTARLSVRVKDKKLNKIREKLARSGIRYEPGRGWMDTSTGIIAPRSDRFVTVTTKSIETTYGKARSKWVTSLNQAEKDGIQYWSGDVYAVQAVRDTHAGKVVADKIKNKAKAFDAAMGRAPKYEGMVYRGQSLPGVKKLKVGDTHDFKYAISTSKKFDVAEEFAGYSVDDAVVFEIRTKSGVDIADLVVEDYQNQAEVYLRGKKQYRVVSKRWVKDVDFDGGGYTRIVIDEI